MACLPVGQLLAECLLQNADRKYVNSAFRGAVGAAKSRDKREKVDVGSIPREKILSDAYERFIELLSRKQKDSPLNMAEIPIQFDDVPQDYHESFKNDPKARLIFWILHGSVNNAN
jgi:hypothetical protein